MRRRVLRFPARRCQGAHCTVELKHDEVVRGQPSKLHDRESGIAVRSTYDGGANSHGSKCTPYEQILVALLLRLKDLFVTTCLGYWLPVCDSR